MRTGRLNDPLTHVEHCGPALRVAANKKLDVITKALPESILGVPVEYDVTYDSPAGVIGGYRYTDFLTTCVGVYPCNATIVRTTLCGLARCEPQPIGLACMESLRKALKDKYRLRTNTKRPKALVVLPGTNMLRQDVVSWEAVDKAVKAGAYIKPHPITLKPDLYRLTQKYGKRVLPLDAALYPMLKACKEVYFTSASETGLAAILLGKVAHVIDGPWQVRPNFSDLYFALGQKVPGRSMQDKLASILSYPQSGIFTTFHAKHTDMEQWVNRFFLHHQRYPHGRDGVYSMSE